MATLARRLDGMQTKNLRLHFLRQPPRRQGGRNDPSKLMLRAARRLAKTLKTSPARPQIEDVAITPWAATLISIIRNQTRPLRKIAQA